MKMQGLILTILIALCYGCATNPATGSQDLVLMSEQDEIALGKQSHQQILQQYSVYNDLELQNYVQYVGKKVASKSHRSNLDYQFTVLDSPEVNAFALPGGYIYITRGLMAYLNTEGELAAVLGHEVGHVTARHAVRQHSATQLTGIGAAIGSVIAESFIPGISSAGGQELVGVLGTAMLRGYGREHELEADRLGAEYLARSGYDPDAMLEVIGVLKDQELFEIKLAREEGRQPRIYHGVFSTHPSSDTRLQEVVGYAHAIKEESSESTFIGKTEYLQRIDGLVYGENSDQGLLKGRDFYHGDMGFAMRFPTGWTVQNLPNQLVAGTANGTAILMVQGADPRLSPKAFMEQRMGLGSVTNGQELTINGLNAYTGTAVINTDVGKRLSRITVIYLQNSAIILAGRTRDVNGLGIYNNAFMETVRSFRPLTNAERDVASRSNRIKIIRADEVTNFGSLVSASTLDKFAEQQLRLINGLYPAGEINSGELVKAVQN
jgi:predicted Zn-dependent protease